MEQGYEKVRTHLQGWIQHVVKKIPHPGDFLLGK